MNYYFTLLNLGEERELDKDSTATDDENEIITFKLTDTTTFYIKDELAVSFKTDGTFKSYTVTISGNDKNTYSLKPKLVCDGTTTGGKECGSTTQNECKEIEFTIKEQGSSLEFDGTKPSGYADKSLAEVKETSDITKALEDYSNKDTCKASGGDESHTLPANVQIKFKISDNVFVYVLNTAAVRISGNEYTYYTVGRGEKTESNAKYTTLTFTSNNECLGTTDPQSYTSCSVTSHTCKGIEAVTVKYTATASTKPAEVQFVSSTPTGYSGLGIDTKPTKTIDEYANQSKCHVIAVPTKTVFKYTQDGYNFIIRDGDGLKYKKGSDMEYTYYTISGNKVSGSYGGSKYTFTATYTCNNKQSTECTAKAETTDCRTLELDVNYYIDSEKKEHIKKISPSEITDTVITTDQADSKLIGDRKNKEFCKDDGDSGDNSHPEPIGDDKVIKTIPDDDVYYVLTKDKYYMKSNEFQISFELKRNTIEGNNFTTFTVKGDATIYESETGFVKDAFSDDIQKDGECTAPSKDFISLSWCNKNCNNVTAIKNRLKIGESDDDNIFAANLTLKNGTNLVFVYKSENHFAKHIGNITDDYKIEREDIGWSVLPTILVSIVLVLLF